MGWECVDWINVAQDRNKWCAVVCVVMSFGIRRRVGDFLSGLGLFPVRVWPFCMASECSDAAIFCL
jgi:hypothetical protein